MANPFSKGWKHLMASFDQKIDENADPKVQIKQAVEGAKKRHQEITESASEIIGNQRQLELRMNRLLKSQDDLQVQVRRALELADKAESEGDSGKAQEYNNAAEVVAAQLVSTDQEIEQVKTQHEAATQAAQQAQEQQKQSEARLREQLAAVDQLMAQADQASMQEMNAETLSSMDSLAPDGNSPTLDSVRAKIEKRYSNALGAQELYQATGGSRIQEALESTEDMQAKSRLDEIRASMAKDKQLTAGDGAAKSEEKPQDEVVEPEVASDSQDKKPSGDVHDAEIEQVLEEAKKAVDDKPADDTK
ncbi:PspA/IM30 family protein [Corynebacterium casei]|uniref:PspA/IM30 family protein n=1 Tax=Corynebacterium casei TaxID=160386 RepID=UPI003FD22B0A